MPCDNIVFWSPVPAGSVFKIKAAGDKTAFTIVVGRSRNGSPKPVIPFRDICPGPASQVINAGDRWSFTPVISVFHTPPQPVTVQAWVEDSAGNVLKFSDDDGNAIQLKCDWSFNTIGGNALKIFVAA